MVGRMYDLVENGVKTGSGGGQDPLIFLVGTLSSVVQLLTLLDHIDKSSIHSSIFK